MKENTLTIKYFNNDYGIQTAANDELFCYETKDLKHALKNSTSNKIFIATGINIKTVIKLAFKHGAIVYLNNTLHYDFSELKDKEETNLNNLLKILSIAHEPILLSNAIEILFDNLKHQIPSKMPLKSALQLVERHISPELNITSSLNKFKALYKEHQNKVKKYIKPAPNEKIVEVKLSYKNELLDFIKKTQGISVLVGGMGSGKSLHGITPYFNYLCLNEGYKPTLITPDIALSKQIIAESDPRHYLNKKNGKSISHLKGLVCCVNSATTNNKFYEYAANSKVILIEEFEECMLALTQQLIKKSGLLSDRAQAMKRFFNLMHKQQLVIADALFSDLSAKEVIKETGKTIYLIENTDPVIMSQRELLLLNQDGHIEKVIQQVSENSNEVSFSDAGQTHSNNFFKLHDIIKSKTKKSTKIINAAFLKKDEGSDFIKNIESFLLKYNYIQISPVLTSGLHFPLEKIKRVNFFASKTILPTQLLQSSGRFRCANLLQMSFVEGNKNYFPTRVAIKMQELIETANEQNFEDELALVENCPEAERVITRILHNNEMRQNYANTTLMLFEMTGTVIKYDTEYTTSTMQNLTKPTPEKFSKLKTLSPKEYEHQNYQRECLSINELEELQKYEALRFYNVLNKPELHTDILTFDNSAKGQKQLKNLHFCRHVDADANLNSAERIKQIVFSKIFNILGVNINSLTGTYDYEELIIAEDFAYKGEIVLHDQVIKMADITPSLFNFKKDGYDNKGAFSTAFLKYFGLKHIQIARRKSKVNGQYSYKFCPERAKQVNKYYGLSFNFD
ncbi:hypothetical protein A9Q74_13060 [Colwellia sp. 39_35_sub15_T18]|nr:hypothetical protein A9Q74_13060 [Colwellia sp. 39_35_sub15_T18]